MAVQVKYIQCAMKRRIAGGLMRTTSYLPHQFANIGRVLKLKDEQGQWTDGWVVEGVGRWVVEGTEALDSRKAIRKHRRATGDSQPRLK